YLGGEYEGGEGGLGTATERGDVERGPRGLREPNDWRTDRESGGREWRGNGGRSDGGTRAGGGYDDMQRGVGAGGMHRSSGVDDARRERRGRWQREALRAREVMTKDVRTVTQDGSLHDVA